MILLPNYATAVPGGYCVSRESFALGLPQDAQEGVIWCGEGPRAWKWPVQASCGQTEARAWYVRGVSKEACCLDRTEEVRSKANGQVGRRGEEESGQEEVAEFWREGL